MAAPPPLIILLTGEPVAPAEAEFGTFVDMIRRRSDGAWSGGWTVMDPRVELPEAPRFEEASGVIISGSPASVTERAPWMLAAEEWLRRVVDARVPVLGICFGHQLLATALGGEVEPNPKGREIGSVDVVMEGEHAWIGFRSGRANATHVDSVLELPPGARTLGWTALEENAVIEFGSDVLGVQFHPEIHAPVMRHYIEARREIIAAEGLSPDALLREVDDGPEGGDVLVRFCQDMARRRL